MRSVRLTILAVALLVGSCVAGSSGTGLPSAVTGVIGLTPVEEHTCLAAYVPLATGQALIGVKWYNNDGSTVFPRLLLSAGAEGGPGVLAEATSVAANLEGASSGWSEVTFPEPVASQEQGLYVIFEFPAYQAYSSVGVGGGPALGYRAGSVGPVGWLSRDGESWARMHPGFRLAVEPMLVGAQEGAKALRGPEEAAEAEPQIQTTALLPAQPNPFNPSVQLQFALREGGPVQLAIYNVRGELVYRLTAAQYPVGVHTVEWQGQDQRGQVCPSGVYFARFKADGVVMTQNLTLVR